jgi:hypothetical protein
MRFTNVFSLLLLTWLCGCGRTEWNWDWAWWQSPSRVVRPSGSADAGRPREGPTAASRPSGEPLLARKSDESESAPPARDLMRSRQESRPYYQLYMVSSGAAREEHPDETLNLRFAKARPCAVLLEMLCVPLGRSGNPEQCYLLYEDRNEFHEAQRLAPMLDVRAVSSPAAPANPEEAFALGVGMMMTVVEQAAVVDNSLVNAAVKRLTEALQAESLDVDRRWAAGVLASRLMCEYKYDHGGARLLAQEAEAIAPALSLQQFTAMYWRADALMQDGKTAEAAALYQDINKRYGPKVTSSQLIKQPKAAAKYKRK